jgi:hypothetical protein
MTQVLGIQVLGIQVLGIQVLGIQVLGMDERVSGLGSSPVKSAAGSATDSKFGTFAIAFGIAFAILYTVLERMNWPLFTYHPAIGRWDFGRELGVSEDGPPMFWYGWIVLSAAGAFVLGLVATAVSGSWLYRATLFFCVLAVLWTAAFAAGNAIADQSRIDVGFLRSIWVAAVPAWLGAAAASYFASSQWARRTWAGWLLIMPICGLVVLGYSLKQYFVQ